MIEQQMAPAAPLLITPAIIIGLHELRDHVASAPPVDMLTLEARLAQPKTRKLHRAQMARQTVTIPGPWLFFVTLSIEHGHPVGAARHMSMSVDRMERLPSPQAVQIIAAELGFGRLEGCKIWQEKLSDGRIAVNIVQPIAVGTTASA